MADSIAVPAGSVTHVVGTRPNFMKMAPVLGALSSLGVPQAIVHTGQHYDPALSQVFFTDLGLPPPDLSLGVGSGSHPQQTAALLIALEQALSQLAPRLLVVYGDVNSTLAAALVAAKSGLPVAHVEAGLRSFDETMPEEINRRLVDAVSQVCLVTSPEAVDNLTAERVPADRIHFVGNPMIDSLITVLPRTRPEEILQQWGIPRDYAVATVHRPANVDEPAQATRVVAALAELATRVPVVLPLHPRGGARLVAAGLNQVPGLHVIPPAGYLDFVGLMSAAKLVVTDSGGVQEETTYLRVPCLTLRPNTERPVTITHGTNRLVTFEGLATAVDEVLGAARYDGPLPDLWDGRAGERIAAVLAAAADP